LCRKSQRFLTIEQTPNSRHDAGRGKEAQQRSRCQNGYGAFREKGRRFPTVRVGDKMKVLSKTKSVGVEDGMSQFEVGGTQLKTYLIILSRSFTVYQMGGGYVRAYIVKLCFKV
jgi:hypothetical protein